ncbi:DUF4132 domain-containing protein [bacterium 1XD42-94]|nr:DUF4132 domain-containing protein [bacterium 1XD42-76]NBK05096.1 DUF4132 domain-containing protein [bacterium 1XD42-94]
MADFTYETRRKLTDAWEASVKKADSGLGSLEKQLLSEMSTYSAYAQSSGKMKELLRNGTYQNLSGLYRGELPRLVKICVPEQNRDEFYYALDQLNQYQMTAGWYRRSARTKSYELFVYRSIQLLWAYSRLGFYQGSLADVLMGRVAPEFYDHARTVRWDYEAMLAAQIDLGNTDTIEAVKDILLGEGNTLMISHGLLTGIVMSKSEELYRLLGDFLLAARLQEGARQAVCETMDAGRPEAFLHLFRVIEENNLARYSSVKRAVGTWIGIFNEKSVDRITDKLLKLMGRCLRDADYCAEQLATNDSVAISCALWAKGFYDAEEGVRAVLELVKNGTKNQKMTASYFNNTLQADNLTMQAAREVLFRWPEDMELIACFLPGFMPDAAGCLTGLVKTESERSYYSLRDAEATEPRPLAPETMFQSRAEAVQVYDILWALLKRMPKKGIELDPCIFPWYRVTMTRSDLAVRLCLLAWMLGDAERLDETAVLIPEIGQGSNGYGISGRMAAARVLLYKPQTQARKNVLFTLLHNPEQYTMEAAFKLLDAMTLTAEDYAEIEKNLKYKKGRRETLAVLKKQELPGLFAGIGRLLQTRSEECHMGALELAVWVKKERPEEFKGLRPLLEAFTEPTGKEQVLLSELTGESSAAQDILSLPGYGLYDPGKEWVLPELSEEIAGAEALFCHTDEEYGQVLESLNRLIGENETLEYTDLYENEKVLGASLDRIHWLRDVEEPLDTYPFRELWEQFYQTEIKTQEFLLELYLYQRCRYREEDYRKILPVYAGTFGRGAEKKPPFETFTGGLRFEKQANTVIDNLFQQYVSRELRLRAALSGIKGLLRILNEENDTYPSQIRRYNGQLENVTKRTGEGPIFSEMLGWLPYADEMQWASAFALRFRLAVHYFSEKRPLRSGYGNQLDRILELSDFVRCYIRGIWDKGMFYKAVFHFLNAGSLTGPVSALEQKGVLTYRQARIQDVNRFLAADPDRFKTTDGKYCFDTAGEDVPELRFAHELYQELVPMILEVELARGEQETPFSYAALNIHMIYGIDTMIRILTALGSDTLSRNGHYYRRNEDRREVLSHLLSVCYPAPGETAADLKRALKGTDITKKRLVELSMYAEQWISIVETYLDMPGFQSGCYYFMAHTCEGMTNMVQSMVAKYTPLSPEELAGGAFDVNWFSEAYEKLGEKNFKMLYDAAKYSSSGTAHARARKYADAALGRVKAEDLKAEIDKKRNKDLLMSLGLLPLSEAHGEREAQILDRYQFIQKFKKESRSFGAQRRASEGRAVDLALRNLSVAAGFSDVTRLTLRMESRLTETANAYFDWKPLGDIEISLSVDEAGKSSLLCRKDGRALKSVPAKYKKDERFLEYQGMNKKLREQYSRSRQMMEQAMEDRTSFEAWELLALMDNPVIRPVVEPLIVKSDRREGILGFLTKDGIMDCFGAVTEISPEETVWIAHPFDLYQSGNWPQYQQKLFESQTRQPFKQVFRELYVKLSEELSKDKSLMFAGNQIQPQKTVGALRGRRWVADYEDGLQKVYYKENIVARIYAMADWFSPSDMEAPTLEYVVFYDRKTFRQMKIGEVPDIIYSEVMRDVDLAVSVAHAGGVDPETSHSTIEMRRAIVECNLGLFKIKNVTFEKAHAVIDGKLGRYTVHLGSGVVHQMGNAMLYVIPVHSQHRGRIFLPFIDDDPKTAEIVSKILLFAEDTKIKDPNILSQIR